MWAPRYWARNFFAGRYWPPAGAVDDANAVVIEGQLGGITGLVDIVQPAPGGGAVGPGAVESFDALLRAGLDNEVTIRGQLRGIRGAVRMRVLDGPRAPAEMRIDGLLGRIRGDVLVAQSWEAVVSEDDELIEMGVL